QVELVVASHIDPTITFHHERVALLVKNAGEYGIIRRARRERRRRQSARILTNDVQVGDGARLVTGGQLRLGAQQNQLLVADNRNRRGRRGPDAEAERRRRAGRTVARDWTLARRQARADLRGVPIVRLTIGLVLHVRLERHVGVQVRVGRLRQAVRRIRRG